MGMEESGDPFAGTDQTAMGILNYDLDDQSKPDGSAPIRRLTRRQQADIESRNDMVAKGILAAQTPQPSGIPTTALTGIFTANNDPQGSVRGFTSFGPNLPVLGPSQVYTGYGANPIGPMSDGSDDETQELAAPETNPLTGTSQCPDGFVFDENLQACRRMNKREMQGSEGGGNVAADQDVFYRQTSLMQRQQMFPLALTSTLPIVASPVLWFPAIVLRTPMDTTGFTRLI